MSNIIPPLLSNTPPPIIGSLDDDEEDEFGHFTSAGDLSYNCEVLSEPSSPTRSPPDDKRDINSNTDQVFSYVNDTYFMPVDKDYQDKRKQCDTSLPALSEIKVNLTQIGEPPVDITVNSHVIPDEPEEESVPRKEAEVNTSVPDHVEHRKNVPSIQNDSIDQGEESETKPPDLKDELSSRNTREKTDFVYIEEPHKLNLDDHKDDDQFDDFSYYVDSVNESESHPQEFCLNEERKIECNIESPSNLQEIKENQTISSNMDNIDSNSLHVEGNLKDEDTIASVQEGAQEDNIDSNSLHVESNLKDQNTVASVQEGAQEDNIDSNTLHIESNLKDENTIASVQEGACDFAVFEENNQVESSIMSLHTEDENVVISEREKMSEFAEFQVPDIESDCKVSNLHTKSTSNDVEQTSDFANFQTPSTSNVNDASVSLQEELPQFANFASFPVETETKNLPEEDFGHFCDFQDTVPQLHEGDSAEDDEFGDFGDYTQNQTNLNVPMIISDDRNILKNAEKIIIDMFPVDMQESCPSVSEHVEFIRNPVFQRVKDITETKALTYQWVKSSCQDNLLKALNIDTRNILYGPAWNPSMPKFAANLSFAPLEPVKSDVLMPTPSQASQESPTPSNIQPEIPSAQFDWNGSGLTNPLDYLEQLVASLDLTTTSSLTSYAPSPSDDFDEWEFWLKSLPKDNKENLSPKSLHTRSNYDLPQTPTNNFEHTTRSQGDNDSVNSLQFVTDVTQDIEETKTKLSTEEDVSKTEDDFGDFASYQSPSKSKTLNKTFEIENTEPGWLKPTLLTPDLPRKMQEEDDFTDFQMVLPSASESKNNPESVSVFPSDILEPLKPTVLTQPHVNAGPLQINWPAPGLSDDDIKNIELTYSTGTLQSKPEIPKMKVVKQNTSEFAPSNSKAFENSSSSQKTKPELQNMSEFITSNSNLGSRKVKSEISLNDDDDWSDFVCNPITAFAPSTTAAGKMHFSGLHQSERCLTPELQLSVPQLTNLHPPKAPIPVITPNGLIQTKIPSNILSINTSSFQPSIPVYPSLQMNSHFQPSIISNQYQNHMNGPVFSQVTKNGFTPGTNKVTSTKNEDDDDDWTDFISSTPAQNVKLHNGVVKNSDWSRVPTPNIITNPVHFDSYRNYVPQNNGKKVLVKPKQLTIPSISALPDLDFIAPKNRTFTKK